MSGSIFDAIEEYGRRLPGSVGEIPHVIFVVEVTGTEAPRIRVLGRNGTVWQAERMRSKQDPTPDEVLTAVWTIEDLADAARYLDTYHTALQYDRSGQAWENAIPEANRRRQFRIDNQIKQEMSRAAREAATPFVCLCGERWKTERGMKQHQRACWKFHPRTGKPVENSHAE